MRTHFIFCVALAALVLPPRLSQADPEGPGARRGAVPAQAHRGEPARFYRGERLAPEYRHRSYVVENWRAHRLDAPPRGYHWVGIGADYLLVAIATGIIVDVMVSQGAAAAPVPAPAAAAVFYYFCESANAYYPYATQCPEGWKVLPSAPPGPLR